MSGKSPSRRDELAGISLGFAGVVLADRDEPPDSMPILTPPPAEDDIENGAIAPQPRRSKNFEGRYVYAATGEFTPVVHDMDLPGRGAVSFTVVRKYRSALADEIGRFGHGWTWAHDKRVHADGEAVVYYTGRGEQYRFTPAGDGTFSHPHFYTMLARLDDGGVELRRTDGVRFTFEAPGEGGENGPSGRLLGYEDPSGNSYEFAYEAGGITITEPRGQKIAITTDADGLITAIEGPGSTQWEYHYGGPNGSSLTAVRRPDGSGITYGYDDRGLLASITDPGQDQPIIETEYERIDGAPRVKRQRLADRDSYDFWYQTIDQYDDGGVTYPIYRTHVARLGQGTSRSDADLHLTHDTNGVSIRRALDVDAEGVANSSLTNAERDERTATLVTETRFNARLEITERQFPEGNVKQWAYAADREDPRARGNLEMFTHVAAPDKPGDYDEVTVSHEYADVGEAVTIWRRTTTVDANGDRRENEYDGAGRQTGWRVADVSHHDVEAGPDGGTTRDVEGHYEYNEHGQLVEREEWGSRTTYEYYDETAYVGPSTEDVDGQETVAEYVSEAGGGLLARVEMDPGDGGLPNAVRETPRESIRTAFVYDGRGVVTARVDGRGNVARIERDALGRVTRTTDRTGAVRTFERDARGNVTTTERSLECHGYDAETDSVTTEETTLTSFFEYDAFGEVVAFGRWADGREHRVELERDERGNVVRRTRGDLAIEYRYGDRNLVVEETWAPGTETESTYSYSYTRDGQPTADTDGKGRTIRRQFDGLRQLHETAFPDGTVGQQRRDAAGQVTDIRLLDGGATGSDATATGTGQAIADGGCTLAATSFDHDAAGRVTAVRRRRVGPLEEGCEPLGESAWDGATGWATEQVIEYGDAGPERVWREPGSVMGYSYDDAGRLVAARSPQGRTTTFEYDATNQIVRNTQQDAAGIFVEGPPDEGEHFQERRVVRDARGRPTTYLVNGSPRRMLWYNDGDQVTRVADTDQTVWNLHDVFGRATGSATAASEGAEAGSDEGTFIATRVEYDDADRVCAAIDPNGRRTRVSYDGRNLPVEVKYPSGGIERAEYDPVGNLVRWIDPSGREYDFEYDAMDDLVRETVDGGERVRRFERDGLGRVVTAVDETNDVTVSRAYDSLDNLLHETQDGLTVERTVDNAGNVMALQYPDGPQVERRHDDIGRLTSVESDAVGQIWAGQYNDAFLETEVYGDGVVRAHTRYSTGCTAGCIDRRWFETANGEVIDGVNYEYNADLTLSSRTWLRDDGGTDEYTYDATRRPAGASYGLGYVAEYDWGRVGILSGATVTADDGDAVRELAPSTDSDYRYETFGNLSFEHDALGNRVGESGFDVQAITDAVPTFPEREYEYDAWNRLADVRCLDDAGEEGRTVEWTYGPFDRPIRKRVTEGTIQTDYRYVWDRDRLRQERRSSETAAGYVGSAEEDENCDATTSYFYGNGLVGVRTESDEEEDECDDEGTYWVTDDGKGNNIGVVDDAGTVVEQYHLDVLGNHLQVVSPGEVDAAGKLGKVVDSVLGTLDAGGRGIADSDGFEGVRENLLGDIPDRRMNERQKGPFGRDSNELSDLFTDPTDIFDDFAKNIDSQVAGGKAMQGNPHSPPKKNKGDWYVGINVSFGGDEAPKVDVEGKAAGMGPGSVSDAKKVVEGVKKMFGGDDKNVNTKGVKKFKQEMQEQDEQKDGSGGKEKTDEGKGKNDSEGKDPGSKKGDPKEGSDDSGTEKKGSESTNGDDSGSDDDSGSNEESGNDNKSGQNDDTGESGTEGDSNGGETKDSKKGSKNSTPARGPGGGCGPTMICRGGGDSNVNIDVPRRDIGNDEPGGCGPAMICREDKGSVEKLPGGGPGRGPGECGPAMICRERNNNGFVPAGAGWGKDDICKYAICKPDALGHDAGKDSIGSGVKGETGSADYGEKLSNDALVGMKSF